jgi:two-component system cell cycle sensor histidine kinase/response regulator CckA
MAVNKMISPRGSETILLMDADPETRKLAAFMLGKQGYTVLEARNRAEVFALFDRRVGDVNLLLLEAKGGGWELAKELKQYQPHVRVLFMRCDSARDAQFVVEQGLPFLRKPFTMCDIAGKVREVLDSRIEKAMTAGGSL